MQARQSILLLLLSLGLLLVGHGVQLTLLPIKANGLGWSEATIGLTGAAYFAGFIVGCFAAPRLLGKAGHIRVYVCLSSLMAATLLVLDMSSQLWIWIAGRFITGWCLAAIYTMAESWLNEHTDNHNRGRFLSIYVIVTLISMASGQLALGVLAEELLFRIAAMIMLISILPIGLFCSDQPMQVPQVSMTLSQVRTLPLLAVAGVLTGGIVTGSMWTMAPGVGEARGFSLAMIGAMMTTIIAGGVFFQLPLGIASDRLGRQTLIRLVAVVCFSSAVGLMVIPDQKFAWFFAGLLVYGGSSLTLYALSAAQAYDVSPLSRIETSAILLAIYGTGSIVGPLLVGLTSLYFQDALFLVSASAMLLLTTATLLLKEGIQATVTILDLTSLNQPAVALGKAM